MEVFASEGKLYGAVTDSGIGIPEAALESIFDKFYQVGSTTRGVREGTGLGLAITRSLIEMHGGRIRVESTPGKGSRFEFVLPLEGPAPPARKPSELDERTHSVLFVTKETERAQRFSPLLSANGFQLLQAESLSEVEDRLKKHGIKAAIVDVASFGAEAWHIMQLLREYRSRSKFHILALVVSQTHNELLGADAVLLKPVEPSLLIRTIRDLVVASPGQPSRILVVDDEHEARELVGETVASIGLLPVLASSGKQALEILSRGPIAGAVVDLLMPEMSGFELIARIRQNAAWSNLPLVVLTAKEMDAAEIHELLVRTDAIFLKSSEWKHSFLQKITDLLKTSTAE